MTAVMWEISHSQAWHPAEWGENEEIGLRDDETPTTKIDVARRRAGRRRSVSNSAV